MRRIALSIIVTVIISMMYVPTILMQQDRSQVPVKVTTNEGQTKELYQGSYALVIGASDYKDWVKLPGVKEDVIAVKAALEKQGFNVEVLLNPTSSVFDERIRDFIAKYGLKKGNRLLIYFAGHGETLKVNNKDEGYVVPIDAPRSTQDEAGFKKLAISMRRINNFAKDIEANHAMFILDSCFAGSIFKREDENKRPPIITLNSLKSVRQFITAGDEKQTVPDRSIFRRWFVRGLGGEADQDNNGYITGIELGNFLRTKVTNESNGTQTPRAEKIDDVDLSEGDFIFALDISERLREEERYWVTVNKKSPGALAEYMLKYPQGKHIREALALIKELEETGSTATANVVRLAFPMPVGTAVAPLMRSYNYETVVLDRNGVIKNRPKGQANYYEDSIGNGIKLEMVYVPRGSYLMGNDDVETAEFVKEVKKYCKDCDAETWASWSKPQHRVEVEGFYVGKYEVTQGQWKAIMGSNPSNFTGDENLPVEQVSWNEAVEFCKKLSAKTGREYRLPSEAEWEYAARGGTTTEFGYGETINTNLVNYDGNYPYGGATKGEYRRKTVKAGSLPPNGYGLYEMHGNVWEWCQDSWHDSYNNAPKDGRVWEAGADNSRRVLRGGSWDSNANFCRSACRGWLAPDARNADLGFRVVASARTLK